MGSPSTSSSPTRVTLRSPLRKLSRTERRSNIALNRSPSGLLGSDRSIRTNLSPNIGVLRYMTPSTMRTSVPSPSWSPFSVMAIAGGSSE